MTFAQTTETLDDLTVAESTGLVAGFFTLWFIWLIYIVALIIAAWKIFEKAGEEGWKSIIPFYNTYTLFRIAGRNGWWFLGLLVPVLNIVIAAMLALDLGKHFGKSTLFSVVGLFLFQPIGMLILGFGDAKYVGTKHE